ncbi:MAG: DUF420 domain-containing protein [Pirellulales bacterium]
MDYPGIDGFLGTRASIMLDVVFLAMFVVLPVMGWSIWLVKHRQRFGLHKTVQLVLGVVLLLAVTAFEVDMRFISGWTERAAGPAGGEPAAVVYRALSVHLVFAISTALLWTFVIVQALRKFPHPPRPCDYSPRHKLWAWLAAIDMTGTAITGWIFYWLAFARTLE